MFHFLPSDSHCVDVTPNCCHQICFSQFGYTGECDQAIMTGYIQLAEQVVLLGLFYNPLNFLVAFASPVECF